MWQHRRRTKGRTHRGALLHSRISLGRSKVAQKRIKKRFINALLILLAVAVVVFGASLVSYHPKLSAQKITVLGNAGVATTAIEARILSDTATPAWGLYSRQNIVLYPAAALENTLAFEFPEIETIDIKRHITTREIVVHITERVPYAVWCRDEVCYHIDADGFVFKEAIDTNELIRFAGGVAEERITPLRALVAPEHFTAMKEFFAGLNNLGLSVTATVFDGEDGYITFDTGWELRVALDKDLGAAAFNLAAILDQYDLRSQLNELLYIDIRFDERVYYKVREVADNEE